MEIYGKMGISIGWKEDLKWRWLFKEFFIRKFLVFREMKQWNFYLEENVLSLSKIEKYADRYLNDQDDLQAFKEEGKL